MGRRPWRRSAGDIFTSRAAAAALAEALAAGLTWVVLCPPPVHAAASMVNTAMAAMPASRLGRRTGALSLRRIVIPLCGSYREPAIYLRAARITK